VMKAMLNYGVERRLIKTNDLKPVHYLTVSPADKRPRRAFAQEEFGRLLKHEHRHGSRKDSAAMDPCECRDLWLVLGHTGMRAGELLGLDWEDVDFEQDQIHVRGTKTKASNRYVPMSHAVGEVLVRRAWRVGATGHRPAGPVFRTRKGDRLRWNLWAKLQRCLVAAGIDQHGADLHSFRYSFATWLIQAGESPKTVQLLLGHETVEMTLRIYAQVLSGDQRRAIQVLDGKGDTEAGAFHKGFTRGADFRKIVG